MDATIDAQQPDFLALLVPFEQGAAAESEKGPIPVEELDAGSNSVAYWVKHAEGVDLVWLRSVGAATSLTLPNGSVVTTDAALTILNENGSGGLIVRGTTVQLNETVVETTEDVHSW